MVYDCLAEIEDLPEMLFKTLTLPFPPMIGMTLLEAYADSGECMLEVGAVSWSIHRRVFEIDLYYKLSDTDEDDYSAYDLQRVYDRLLSAGWHPPKSLE